MTPYFCHYNYFKYVMALFLNLLGEGCISQLAAAIGTQLTHTQLYPSAHHSPSPP